MNLYKRINIVFLLLFLSLASYSQNYFLKTNVLGPIIKQPFNIGFEINKLKPHSYVFTVEGGWYMIDSADKFEQDFWTKRITGFGFIPEYRYYFRYRSNLNKPVGFFAGGYLIARFLKYEHDYDYPSTLTDILEDSFAGGGGALIGYKFKRPDSKFFLEGLFGVGLGYIEIENFESDYMRDQYLLSRLEISVGYTFQ